MDTWNFFLQYAACRSCKLSIQGHYADAEVGGWELPLANDHRSSAFFSAFGRAMPFWAGLNHCSPLRECHILSNFSSKENCNGESQMFQCLMALFTMKLLWLHVGIMKSALNWQDRQPDHHSESASEMILREWADLMTLVGCEIQSNRTLNFGPNTELTMDVSLKHDKTVIIYWKQQNACCWTRCKYGDFYQKQGHMFASMICNTLNA